MIMNLPSQALSWPSACFPNASVIPMTVRLVSLVQGRRAMDIVACIRFLTEPIPREALATSICPASRDSVFDISIRIPHFPFAYPTSFTGAQHVAIPTRAHPWVTTNFETLEEAPGRDAFPRGGNPGAKPLAGTSCRIRPYAIVVWVFALLFIGEFAQRGASRRVGFHDVLKGFHISEHFFQLRIFVACDRVSMAVGIFCYADSMDAFPKGCCRCQQPQKHSKFR